MGTVLSGILGFLASLPELVKLARELFETLRGFISSIEKKQAAKELTEALKTARETKDTSALEKFFNPS